VPGSAGLEYATYFGSYYADNIDDIVVQGASTETLGTVYFAGSVGYQTPHAKDKTITPFPATLDAFKSELDPLHEIWDGFFGVLEPLGNGTSDLVFCTLIGGIENDNLAALALDQNGDVYLGGHTYSDATSFFPAFTDTIGPRLDKDAIALKVQLQGGTPPAAPTNLVATAVSSSAIDLTWVDNANNEDAFKLERSMDGNNWNWSQLLDPDTTSYSDEGLSANTEYFYRIRAQNSAGPSDFSNIASDTTWSNGGGGDFTANADIPVANGSIEGTYLDTLEADDIWEGFWERESGGKPSKRYSYLEHKWTIHVGGGSNPEFHLKADRSAVYGVDDFVFAYSTDDVTYTDMIIVDENTPQDEYQTFTLPPTLSGTVYIRVKDTDQGAGNREIDGVRVDHMFIRTY
jgi:hypothetical protein